jgi:transposase
VTDLGDNLTMEFAITAREIAEAVAREIIGDRGYDSDPLRARLAARGIGLIAPHRGNRSKPRTQDGRALRRYLRRWIVERTFAWLGHYRRLVVRHDRSITIYEAFFNIACS